MTTMAMTTMVREYRVERRRECDSANERDNETETEGRKRERVRENSMVPTKDNATINHNRERETKGREREQPNDSAECRYNNLTARTNKCASNDGTQKAVATMARQKISNIIIIA